MASFFNDAKKFLGVGSRADLKEGVPPPSMSKSDQVALLLKQLLIFFGVMRVLTLGFLGSLGTATAASGLAWAARKYPNFIPKQVRGLLVYVDHMHKTKWHKLALCFIIDSLSASMHFLPGWMYWLLGESGFQPANTFLVQYMFQKPWLTALNVFEHKIPFLNFFPSATVGWLFEFGILKEEWFGKIYEFVQKVQGKIPIPGEKK